MHHLPRPKHAIPSEFDRVRYVCQEDYDGGPFWTYPLRMNRAYVLPTADNLQYPIYEQRHPTPTKELEAFFQTWLFFGLLGEIFGKLFNPSDFMCIVETETGPERLLSTSKLLTLTDTWIKKVKSAAHDQQTRYQHIANCL